MTSIVRSKPELQILTHVFMVFALFITSNVFAANATDTQTHVCKNNSGALVDDSLCIANVGPKPVDNTRVGISCTSAYQTSAFDKDYDGWIAYANGNEIRMCNRINIYNWACNGYADCTLESFNIVQNTSIQCAVTGVIKFTSADGHYYGPVSDSIPEFNPNGTDGNDGYCTNTRPDCANGANYDGNLTSVDQGGDGTMYRWTCSKNGVSQQCGQTVCPRGGCQ